MTAKEQLRELIERLSDEEAAELLDEVRWLVEETETLSETEMASVLEGEAEIARGEWVDGEAFFRSLGL